MQVQTTLISLLEFMNHAQHPLKEDKTPFKLTKLALRAEKPTFALRCAQEDYEQACATSSKDKRATQTALIQIYTQLDMFDEARGLAKKCGIAINESGSAILHIWGMDNSIKVSQGNEDFLAAIADLEINEKWDEIAGRYQTFAEKISNTERSNAAFTFAHAFYRLGQWDMFNRVISQIDDSVTVTIFRAMEALKNSTDKVKDVNRLVEEGFQKLGSEAGPLFAHGLTAVSPFIIYSQQLVELKELAKWTDRSRLVWKERLENNTAHFNALRSLLMMRIDIIGNDSIEPSLSFLKLARHSNEWDVFEGFFNRHFANDSNMMKLPEVAHEHLRLLLKRGREDEAFNELDAMINSINADQNPILIAKIYLLKAKWIARNTITSDKDTLKMVRDLCDRSLRYRQDHYRANNMWAWSNMRLFTIDEGSRAQCAIDSIMAFARCLSLEPKNCFADLLQLVSILFRSSNIPEVYTTTAETIKKIPLKHFISILPQLVVYQYTNSDPLREFVSNLLTTLLETYPNAAIFPLLFAASIGNERSVITSIINNFRATQPAFYNSAVTIIDGLCAACVTLSEYVTEAMSTIASMDKDPSEEELASLDELAKQWLARIQTTTCEYDTHAQQRFKDKLKAFEITLMDYLNKPKPDNYGQLYRKKLEIIQMKTLFEQECSKERRLVLGYVSPSLAELTHSPIAVFGTFKTDAPTVTINRFRNEIGILHSKQRPRQIKIVGSDHRTYTFLLKGREDLRQDQRVMQFFELMNNLTSSNSPRITITSITPLTHSVGLIEWVPGTDTIFSLVREYRHAKNIDVMLETDIILDRVPYDPNRMTPILRHEILNEVAEETLDRVDDLKDIMWLKAADTEAWVRHTLAFSRSSALMSIVGYIIGLGDRHTSNIMIQRHTGSVVHIDFGDCFEVTNKRVQQPELIPFRLTRMIISALGPCGVDGSFRRTCEDTISTIREHREAVMAVLEIFFREPVSSGRFFDKVSAHENVHIDFSDAGHRSLGKLTQIVSRIGDKINGTDYGNNTPLTVSEQVEALFQSATDTYNLAYLYMGWSPLW